MVQLQPCQFARVVSLFDDDLPNRPILESVLADRNPGWVFADPEERPTAAVVVSRYSFTYLGASRTASCWTSRWPARRQWRTPS